MGPHLMKLLTAISTMAVSVMLLRVGSAADLGSDRAALLALRSAVGGRSLLWNLTQMTPCSWVGVECELGRVTQLRLPGMGLSGVIPAGGVIGNLTRLHTLSLRFNALSGTVPADVAACRDLRNLYLQGNLFSGKIPAALFSLPNLVRLNLAGNNFSGEISPGFGNLTRLGTLFLENNQLTGSIPDLKLPGLVQFNVSSNHLNGSIPSSLSRMPASAFLGNSLCGGPLLACSNNGSTVITGGNSGGGVGSKLSGGAIAGIVIGSVLGFILILLILYLLLRKKSKSRGKTRSLDIPPPKGETPGEKSGGADELRSIGYGGGVVAAAAAPAPAAMAAAGSVNGNGKEESKGLVFFGNAHKVFDLESLLRASAEVLGKGTFGTAYKATLEMGIAVAVKRLKDVVIPEREFREKIESVGRMDHENLVPLRAYYFSGDEKLLVYDYMPMGSLSALLHGSKGAGRTPLNWETRFSIALGAARGISYLHSQSPTTSHGNIKSSNILLTTSYEPRVSDFGLAHIVGAASSPSRVSGYRAPEVTDARKVSQKADVYSFGVLLLELLTGKAPTHALLNEEGVDLPRWVQSVVREEWTSEVFDLELLRYQNVEEMVELLQLAVDCAAQYPDNRPSMDEVSKRMEELCHSRSQKTEDSQLELGNGLNDESSRGTHSVASGAPPPVAN